MTSGKICSYKDDRFVDNAELVILNNNEEENLLGVEFKIVDFEIPEDAIEEIPVPNPVNSNISVYSEKRTISKISVTFKVDFDLSNYWAIRGEIDKVKGFDTIKASENDMDLALVLYDNKNVRLYPIIFKRCKILSVSKIRFKVGQKTNVKKCDIMFSCTNVYKGG